MRLGELLLFRYRMPTDERFRLDRALRAKWFGDANVCAYGSLAVSDGAAAAFPYADVAVTNLTLAGTVSARSLAVKNLDVVGDAVVSAPLPVGSGGRLALNWNGVDGFACADASSFAIEAGGTLEVNGLGALPPCGSSYKVIGTETVSGSPSGWIWHSADRSVRAFLERKADGLYVTFGSGGFRVIFR